MCTASARRRSPRRQSGRTAGTRRRRSGSRSGRATGSRRRGFRRSTRIAGARRRSTRGRSRRARPGGLPASRLPLEASSLSPRSHRTLEPRLSGTRSFQRVQGRQPRRTMQPVRHQSLQFHDPHPLGRNRHHHSGQARARFAQLERVHAPAARGECIGQLVEPLGSTHSCGVPTEVRPENRIEQ
jgi:hypothetical protein